MTALELFLYILLGALVQVAIAAFVVLVKRWRDLRFMQKRMAGLEVATPSEPILDDLKSAFKPGPWKGERAFRVAKREIESPDGKICSFYLEPEDGGGLADFKPGQFLTFQLDIADPTSSGPAKAVTRCYSLSDAPGGGRYRVTIKRVEPPFDRPDVAPGVSSSYFHDHVDEGDVLQVRAPSGHFYLERGTSPVVLIAGGIGITPMISMLNDSLAHDEGREVWLFYGVRNSKEQAMQEHLERLDGRYPNFHLHVCYSRPLPGDELGRDYQHDGHVDVDLLRRTLKFQVYDFYICGPRAMMESLVPALDEWGVPDQHIHYEAFGPASIPRPNRKKDQPSDEGEEPQGPVNVTFATSGKTIAWDPACDSLLEFAEQNGIEIASGCRAGGCGTCQTTITSGEVRYNHSPDFDPEPGACLMCVSRPKHDVTLEA